MPTALQAPAATRPSQTMVLSGFVGFQALDAVTTHLGLARDHHELNRLMAPLISVHGELAAYAVKGVAVAVLLAVLMLLQHTRPRIWHAFHAAAWISAVAVVLNLVQLIR